MSEVKFNIKINVGGKDQVVLASTDVKEFADAFEDTKVKAVKFRDSLLYYSCFSNP